MQLRKARATMLGVGLMATAALTACGGDSRDVERTGDPQAPGDGVVEVIASEYEFSGVPSTLPARKTTFSLANEGREPHEMVIFRMKDDTPLDRLLSMPERQAQEHVEVAGGTGAGPGNEAKRPVTASLKVGSYAMVCFVPAPDDQPHFRHGMIKEFEVGA